MNFNKFGVSANAVSPLMPEAKASRIRSNGEQKLTETGWIKLAASLTARFSSIKCNNYKGHWSFGSGLFNLPYLFSVINRLIAVPAHSCGNSSLKLLSVIQMSTKG